MNADKEEQILIRRFMDLARTADNKNIITYSDFLNLSEISLFHSVKHTLLNINYELFGGFSHAERKVLCFYGDDSVKAFSDYIHCIRIVPANKKFSDDLKHPDFLGAILNLGIDRGKIGDILVKEREGYVYVLSSVSEFILTTLTKVKHTNVVLKLATEEDINIEPDFITIRGTVSSERLDSIIALAFKTSRSGIAPLISGQKVYVDGKLVEHNSYNLKEDETVSVRGYGKFIYKGLENQTKKGRYYVTLLKYS